MDTRPHAPLSPAPAGDSPHGDAPFAGTVLITGATQGLGRHLALDLARRGATVLLHGRDRSRLDDAAAEVRAAAPTVAVRTYLADLADLDQARDLAARILAAEPRLDVLVNNAAVGGGAHPARRDVSRQGHELRFAVNHLAPYVLTRGLLPLLAASAPARVVNVASMGQAPIDFDDVMMERDYEGLEAYCRSKLAMIMSTFDLAAELADRGITVNVLHPAHLMDTRAVREYGLTPAVSIDEGVRPTARLITDPALAGVTGRYFDRFTERPAHAQAYDPAARTRLAVVTDELGGRVRTAVGGGAADVRDEAVADRGARPGG
ncbi:SDR family NAD(P)-dependent oxidoreductase [Kitasatospora sp. NPDC050543]|uniref:SDR family NAD(P)-dependent oxidoreductase n=1 Tax=Kitasatospora sp. NPDC050543 TaxID=3364054 RepID=UPI0037A5A4F2